MIKVFLAISRWLAGYTSFFIIGIAIFTFFLPHTFDWVRGNTQTVILGVIMLTMGLTLTTEDFRILARRPLDIFIGAAAQFIIMPGVAYILVHVFHLYPPIAIGILLVGLLSGRSVEQHYVVFVPWRRGFFRRHDLRFHFACPLYDSLSHEADCRTNCCG